MKQLIKQVEQWGTERGLHTADKSEMQFIKLIEEIGEVGEAYTEEDMVDGVGDSLVVMILLCLQNNYDFYEIYELIGSVSPMITMTSGNADKILLGSYRKIMSSLGQMARRYCRNEKLVMPMVLWRITLELQMILSVTTGHSLKVALEHAYNEIKDRTGHQNELGVFVKDV